MTKGTRSLILFGAAIIAVPTVAFAISQGSAHAKAHRQRGLVQFVARVDGVSPTILRSDLRRGETLFAIPGARYGSPEALAQALLLPIKSRLEAAGRGDRLLESGLTKLYPLLLTKIESIVQRTHPGRVLRHFVRSLHLRSLTTVLLHATKIICHSNGREIRLDLRVGALSLRQCHLGSRLGGAKKLVVALKAIVRTAFVDLRLVRLLRVQAQWSIERHVEPRLSTLLKQILPASP